ncbi:tetratricopeptide repeat protein [Methylobacillus gramineus]|uniref:tetratricopeptide repeat protein n=1 Tax=Methylobacillus gramineus TaxID=755169 RepID=UPI001CFFCD8A|nr:tetratricopeptide repeat protein [Methylobacillus gramineus]MCB5183816.1 tetratricopeptide repeat protein [Methylobacillus gramineus]
MYLFIKHSLLLFIFTISSCTTVSQQHILNTEGNRAYLTAHYQEAAQRYEKALEAAQKNKDQQYIAIASYGLGRANIKLCRLDEAEHWLKKSIQAREALADSNLAYLSQNLSELARLYMAQLRYADAITLFYKATPMLYRLKEDNNDPIALANQLDAYEEALRKTGRTAEADTIANKAKELRQNNRGKVALFKAEAIPQSCLAHDN